MLFSNERETESDGLTALMAACQYGRLNAAEVLIKSGADVNAKTLVQKMTALMYASKAYVSKGGESLKLVKHLLRNGADKNAKDADGRNAYFYAGKDPEIRAVLK